jgi:glycerophosphoryl diester phosphodiesterase
MALLCFWLLLKKAILYLETGSAQKFLNFDQPTRSGLSFIFWERPSFKNLPCFRALLVLVSVLLTSCSPNAQEKILLVHQKRKVMLTAHRGASGVAPENTLAAIQKALDSPADFIEIDIHQTRDSQLVVMHDATLNRTTNGKGTIVDYSLAEIKKLDAGSWFKPEFKNERVPTLEEVLLLVKGRKKLLIELKKGSDFYPGMPHQTIALLRKYKARNWCVLQTFHDEILQQIWQNEYPVTTHKLIVGKLPLLPVYFDTSLRFGSFDKYYRASAINVHRYFASRGFVKMVHNAGFKTFVWTVDDPAEINKLVNRGVDGILTNAAATLVVE